jgi:hypothetical protein
MSRRCCAGRGLRMWKSGLLELRSGVRSPLTLAFLEGMRRVILAREGIRLVMGRARALRGGMERIAKWILPSGRSSFRGIAMLPPA